MTRLPSAAAPSARANPGRAKQRPTADILTTQAPTDQRKITQDHTDQALAAAVTRWRRAVHRCPEAAWTEFQTTAFVAETLASLGYAPRVGREILVPADCLGLPPPSALKRARARAARRGASRLWLQRMGTATGVVADLHPGREPDLVLRFDLDALEIQEAQGPEHRPAREGFASIHPGLCHACGHDGHAALGLGVAALLQREAAAIPGNVRLLFQPAEEGVRGASALIRHVLGARYFLAAHLGLAARATGRLITGLSGFAATTKFNVHFTGRAAHAGLAPDAGRDALKGAAAALLALHALTEEPGPAQEADPAESGERRDRINVGRLEGGTARNSVPDQALLICETRCASKHADAALLRRARELVASIAREHGLEWRLDVVGRAGCARSDPALAGLLARIALELPPRPDGRPFFRPEDVRSHGVMTASEDAATLMEAVRISGGQAAYALIGADLAADHHAPAFDFDEAALWPAALWLAEACKRLCAA